jgi:L-ornithine N5-oxygenase
MDFIDPSLSRPNMASKALVNGNHGNGGSKGRSFLERFDDNEIHDLICVGFGPASLAIAVALNDEIENHNPAVTASPPKVRFMERQEKFRWHAGMLLPGTKMQITFIKDLATLRNPRSQFTFLNYLHCNNRLVQFTNLGTFLPQRIEYEDYMRWCANHFDNVVDYRYDVHAVDVGRANPKTGAVEYFQIKATDRTFGVPILRRAKNVVIAVGGRPNIPKCLNTNHPRVIHSSQYATTISQIFLAGTAPRTFAVIGAGQSAAEVFHNIPSLFPGSKSYLLIKGSALRPSDDSPL